MWPKPLTPLHNSFTVRRLEEKGTNMTNNTVPHWINGARDLGTTDRTAPVYEP